MDEFIGIIILIIVFSLLERVLKGAQKGKTPPPEADEEASASGERPQLSGLPGKLEELIAEELGISMERRPRVQPPQGREVGSPPAAPPARAEAAPPASTRVVVYPQERPRRERLPEGTRRDTEAARLARPPVRRRKPEPARRPPSVEEAPVSLEERGMRERGEAVSLEQPRRPADHERFHERYRVPKPVSSHGEFHERYIERQKRPVRRPARTALPDNAGWSDVQRAIIWAEVLGPPKGLE